MELLLSLFLGASEKAFYAYTSKSFSAGKWRVYHKGKRNNIQVYITARDIGISRHAHHIDNRIN